MQESLDMRNLETIIYRLSLDELRKATDMIRDTWKRKERKLTNKFTVGDHVTFIGAYGRVMAAEVIKVNYSRVKVLTSDGRRYNCSPSLLTINPMKKSGKQVTAKEAVDYEDSLADDYYGDNQSAIDNAPVKKMKPMKLG